MRERGFTMNNNCCVLIPAFQPGEGLAAYVEALLAAGMERVVVVDDGSGASYGEVFGRLKEIDGCVVLKHTENRGKGAAVKTGMAWLLSQGFEENQVWTGVITADCDGQHCVGDVSRIAERLRRDPGSLVLGCREFGEETPGKSAFGNRVISFGMNLLYGIDLRDTQTGLRGIPSDLLPDAARLPGDRYEYELNMLIYAGKAGIPLSVVPIRTIYYDGNRGSHYRAIRDSARILACLFRGKAGGGPEPVTEANRAPEGARGKGQTAGKALTLSWPRKQEGLQ